MSLTSIAFLAFAAVVLFVYYLTPGKYRWAVLLVASIAFYISFSVVGIILLIVLSLVACFCALQIEKTQKRQEMWLTEHSDTDKETKKAAKRQFKGVQRRYVILTIVLCIGSLFLLKYYGPFASEINRLLGTRFWTAENLLVPLGISFYSLQIIGYVIDVSRGIARAERNPLKVILYASFFLSIMQGPFNRWNDLMPQIVTEEKKKLEFRQFKLAVLRIAWGYIKKMCIADQVGLIAAEVFGHYEKYAGLGILLGMFCFAVQLYTDFSGYMEIVNGIGDLLGIKMPKNFRQPFFSRNMSEFWQRWHITLGAWLKDYLFYPVLKSSWLQRFGKWLTSHFGKGLGRRLPTYIGMLILWTLIGAWHGAGFNYVFGVGLLQFLYIFLGEIAAPATERVKKFLHIKNENFFWHAFQSIRCTVLMIFAWVFFNSRTFIDGVHMLGRIFSGIPGFGQITTVFDSGSDVLVGSWKIWLPYLLVCVLVLFVVDLLHEKDVHIRENIEKKPYAVRMLVYLAIIFTIIIFGAYGSQINVSNFIYVNF